MHTERLAQFGNHYRSLSDEELENIALTKAATLLPEALHALRQELGTRGASLAVSAGIDSQLKTWTAQELAELIHQYRNTPCPRCSRQASLLNAVHAAVAHGMLVHSMFEHHLVVGCRDCIKTEVQRLSNRSLLLGWWALPMGPINTVRALNTNGKALRAIESEQATPELAAYVSRTVGRVVAKIARLQSMR